MIPFSMEVFKVNISLRERMAQKKRSSRSDFKAWSRGKKSQSLILRFTKEIGWGI